MSQMQKGNLREETGTEFRPRCNNHKKDINDNNKPIAAHYNQTRCKINIIRCVLLVFSFKSQQERHKSELKHILKI